MASGEPYTGYKVYDKTGTNVLISKMDTDSATISTLLQSQDAVSLGITAVSGTIGGTALSDSVVLENYYDSAPNRELGNLFLYDVTPEPQVETVTGFYLDGTEYKFDGGGGGGDMLYADFGWQTKTGATITLDLASTYEPSANFTVNAPSTIRDGQTYILRVNNGATAYTMTLGTNVTNPYGTSIELTANGIDQFVFLAIDGELELQPEGGGGGSSDAFILAPNSPLTPKYFWYGTQEQYEALSQYYTDEENDTVYYTI